MIIALISTVLPVGGFKVLSPQLETPATLTLHFQFPAQERAGVAGHSGGVEAAAGGAPEACDLL